MGDKKNEIRDIVEVYKPAICGEKTTRWKTLCAEVDNHILRIYHKSFENTFTDKLSSLWNRGSAGAYSPHIRQSRNAIVYMTIGDVTCTWRKLLYELLEEDTAPVFDENIGFVSSPTISTPRVLQLDIHPRLYPRLC